MLEEVVVAHHRRSPTGEYFVVEVKVSTSINLEGWLPRFIEEAIDEKVPQIKKIYSDDEIDEKLAGSHLFLTYKIRSSDRALLGLVEALTTAVQEGMSNGEKVAELFHRWQRCQQYKQAKERVNV